MDRQSSRAAVLALMLALWSGAANADWTALGSGDNIHQPYADRASISRHGAMVRMTGLYDFRRQDLTPDGLRLFSTMVLREYDCENRRVRLLSAIDFSDHMGAGGPVWTDEVPRRWEPVVEESLDEVFWNVACGRN